MKMFETEIKKSLFALNIYLLFFFRYCDSRRKVLLEHVHEGYEKDWWVYTE